MTISDVSIKNPVFAWMLMIGLIVFGWVSFTRMGISQLPDVDFPVVTVHITWEGAAPEAKAAAWKAFDLHAQKVANWFGVSNISSAL